VAPDPLMQSQEALWQVSSLRVRQLQRQYAADGTTISLETEVEYDIAVGPPEQLTGVVRSPAGTEMFVCAALQSRRTCWGRVGRHPWTRRMDMDASTWLGDLQQFWRQVVVQKVEVLTASREIVVEWSFPSPTSDEQPIAGRTWLQADSYLPQRVMWERRSNDGALAATLETFFFDYGASVSVEAPVVATVTPVPTLRAPEATLLVAQAEMPLPGALFVPQAPGPFPAVVLLHGSEGGTDSTRLIANELAHAGYLALALCYFECPGTPEALHNINIETVMEAVDYLMARSDVRPEAVGLVGYSRGAELALVVGSLDPDVRAVVSAMGSPWINPGLPKVGSGEAWLYQGKPPPFAVIPVEHINGPVLLLHGEQDRLWPVAYSYMIADRLEAHSHSYELAVYSARGHDVGLDPPDAIQRTIAFLDRALP
jgi:dienelactone hydrolase